MKNRIPIYLISDYVLPFLVTVCILAFFSLQIYILKGDSEITKADLEYSQKLSLKWAQMASSIDQQIIQAISRTNIRVSKLEQAPTELRELISSIERPPGGG